MLHGLSSLLVDLVCPVCGEARARGEILCPWCSAGLFGNRGIRWSCTGGPDPGEAGPTTGVPVHSPFLHAGSAREIVIGLKFGGRRRLAGTAAALIAGFSAVLPGSGDLVVPMPLCRERMKVRGYNQAAEMARHLARMCGSRMVDCLRRDHRPPQTGLDSAGRRANAAGSFGSASPGYRFDAPAWLVDDVMTTGATIDAAAATLRGMGAVVAGAVTLTYRPAFLQYIINGRAMRSEE